MRTTDDNAKFRRGFSLVEILVVITIMGILAAAVAINVTGYVGESRHKRARMDLATLKNALDLFYLQYHRYPTNDEGLAILTAPSKTHAMGIVAELPTDPWGNPYEYRHPGQHGNYDVVCYGRDGAPGGDGEDADIGSWDHISSDTTNRPSTDF